MNDIEKILTISVAAYNVETMIEQNIKSVINSNVKDNIELIITDDGSTDRTTEIVEKYASKYPKIVKLIKQKNAGPGSTVNSGIRNATGKYFRIVDGDDWIETKNLEEYIDYLRKIDSDIVATNYEYYNNEKKAIIESVKVNLPQKEILKFNEVCRDLQIEMHNVTFKTSILQNNNVRVDNGFYTDVEYLLFPLPYVKTITYLDIDIYVYRIAQEGQSVSIEGLQKHIKDYDTMFNHMLLFYEKNKEDLDENINKYLSDKISTFASMEVGTLLTFKTNIDNKKRIVEFHKNLKKKSKDIYIKYKKTKRAKILIYSHYILYKFASKKYIAKIKNEW